MKMPLPTAWISRATINSAKLDAKMPISDPTKLNNAAAKYSVRSGMRRKKNAMHMTTIVPAIM